MCGICGEIRFDRPLETVSGVERMMAAMASRGPDARGLAAQNRWALGHRRLKIIDLSEQAQQPMVDSHLGLAVVYNGALYNYPELRRDLENRGYRFFSSGDTEVVLKAYHAWGADALRRFNGMFAFAVVHRDEPRVVLARDRLGIKPLYYAFERGRLRFASTLPALAAAGGVDTSIDPAGLHHYLSFHAVVPAPRTILAGVRKLAPASILTVGPEGTRRDVYWRLDFGPRKDERDLGFDDWRERLTTALDASVRRRLTADVPVGVLLSGGVDSSLVVALLAGQGATGLKTFSIGFEGVGTEAGDEFPYSNRVARRFATDHHRIRVGAAETLDTLDAAIDAMSEPMVSHDCIGFYLLSREVARQVKVVLSGQGADEVFAGYHWYPPLAAADDPVADYTRLFCDRSPEEVAATVHPRLRNGDPSRDFVSRHFARSGAPSALDKALRLDTTVMLVEDPVKRVDNMTMAWGLEARVPFLDHELVELAARIPGTHKVSGGGKHILKEAARPLLPASVVDRPKGYFPVPALKYLRGPFLDYVRGVLSEDRLHARRLFEPAAVRDLLAAPEDHLTPLGGSKLWQLAVLERWLQRHGIGSG